MPLQTIVTLIAEDGEEYPVALPGSGYSDVAAYNAAHSRLLELMLDHAVKDGVRDEAEVRRYALGMTLGRVEDPADAL